jgi:hypothetical protein
MSKQYSLELEVEARNLKSSAGESINELEMVLQIWQDLKRLGETSGGLQQEDNLIKDVLERILLNEFDSEDKIPYPDYYSRDKKDGE